MFTASGPEELPPFAEDSDVVDIAILNVKEQFSSLKSKHLERVSASMRIHMQVLRQANRNQVGNNVTKCGINLYRFKNFKYLGAINTAVSDILKKSRPNNGYTKQS